MAASSLQDFVGSSHYTFTNANVPKACDLGLLTLLPISDCLLVGFLLDPQLGSSFSGLVVGFRLLSGAVCSILTR